MVNLLEVYGSKCTDDPGYAFTDGHKAIASIDAALSAQTSPDALREAAVGCYTLLKRYREETPPAHSPHMICHIADTAIAEFEAALSAQSAPDHLPADQSVS